MKIKLDGEYFDLEGIPISFQEWIKIIAGPNRVLNQSKVGQFSITTRFVGFKSKCSPPLLYETFIRPETPENHNPFKDFKSMASSKKGAFQSHAEAEVMAQKKLSIL